MRNACRFFTLKILRNMRVGRPGHNLKGKGKGKVSPRTGHEATGEKYTYSSTLSLPSTLDGVDGQRHTPISLPAGNTQYQTCRRLGGPPGRYGQVRKIVPPPRFDPWTVQPVASRYAD
jgi:hypothetical protein